VSFVLNSCIEVSDYNEPYSLCQPLLPSPVSTLGLTRAKPFGIPTPLHEAGLVDVKNRVGRVGILKEKVGKGVEVGVYDRIVNSFEAARV
jgi:hypothetical protein